MKSWQYRIDILEVCSVGKRSAVIGKPVRQSFTLDCSYDLFIDRFQSCVESSKSWDSRTQCEGIPGQRGGIRGQRIDGREDRITIAMNKLSNWCDFYVLIYAKICIYIYICVYVFLLIIWVYSWVEGDSTLLIVLLRKSRSYNCGKWEREFK